ncbi:MAG: hypothetical protein GQ527_11510 [Bacteroidales bacterium]|nr:hypothetical protein [Bacteroidales bacterium]
MKNKTNIFLIFFSMAIIFASCDNNFDDKKVQLRTHQDSISYIIGYDYGEGIGLKDIEISQDALLKGLMEGMTGKSTLPDSVITKLVLNFQKEMDDQEEKQMRTTIEATMVEGAAYLEKNITLDGVIELENGLQYKITKEGIGFQPLSTDSVSIHFRAMFLDGTTFDMSYDQGPAGVRLNRMIKGLSQGIQLMKTGAIYEFYIPYYLAYGENNFANIIPGGSTLRYHVELIKINK